jgi:hypothetical protein
MRNVKKLEETIQKEVTNTIGYTRKQANKEWFDEECAEVNEEKNDARERAIQNNTRGAKNAYKPARTRERRLFRKRQSRAATRLYSRVSDIGVFRTLLLNIYYEYSYLQSPEFR